MWWFVIDEVVIGLLNVNCEICDQVRGKKGYKIHLAACRKKSLKSAEQAEENWASPGKIFLFIFVN